MKDYKHQMEKAEKAYKWFLDSTLSEIRWVDEKTPWYEKEPEWWLNMKEIERLVRAKKDLIL